MIKKKCFIYICMLTVLFHCTLRAQAVEIVSDKQSRREITIESNEIEDWPQGPVVNAQSAVLMEASTGTVLYEKNAHAQLYPASITKIMTTLVALENSSLDEEVTFSEESLFSLDSGSSIIGGVNPGDKMSMRDILYGIMICSGNEAAYAAAEHVSGSMQQFVHKMNERAKEIGCTDTNFQNPHGLPNEAHVTSAMDMAKITCTALSNSTFKTIATTRRYTFPPTDKGEERIRLNHHKMMSGMEYTYEGCLGGKTGYTSVAGSTLVTFAQRDGMLLVCVVMNETSPDQFTDTALLLDYGFANFHKLDMSEYAMESVHTEQGFFMSEVSKAMHDTGLSISQTGTAVMPINSSLHMIRGIAASEDTDGTVISEFYYGDKYVGNAVMKVEVQKGKTRQFGSIEDEIPDMISVFQEDQIRYLFINLKIVFGIIGAVIVVIIAIIIYKKADKRRQRRRRTIIMPKRY